MSRLIIITTFFLFMLTFITGCEDLSKTDLGNTTLSAKENGERLLQSLPDALSEQKSVTPELLFGSIDLDNNDKSVQLSVWAQDAQLYNEETAGKIAITKNMEVDVMNCAGYLGSAAANYKNQIWELKLIPETVPKDFEEKVKKCGQDFSGGRVGTPAVAVFPKDEKRKSLKISKIFNLQEIIKKFPEDVRKSAGLDDKNLLKNKQLVNNPGNNAIDLDGDGTIDLIVIGIDCIPGEDSNCELAMRLVDGKWKKAARIEPF